MFITPILNTTGGGLTAAILNKFEELSLPVEDLCRQGNNNGSNVKRKDRSLSLMSNFKNQSMCLLFDL